MKIIYLILLIVFIVVIAIFMGQNLETQHVKFLGFAADLPLAITIAIAYILGMLTGWSVFSFLRKSLYRVTEHKKEKAT